MDLLTENIALNEQNKSLIRRAGKQYNAIAVMFTLLTLFSLITELVRLNKYLNVDFEEWYDTFNFKICSLLFIVYSCIIFMQVYYYYKGIKLQNKAIDAASQESFDLSFSYYVSGNKFSIVSMIIYIPIEIVFLYQELFVFI